MDKTGRKVITIGAARGTSATINGTEYYFLYDGDAIFRIQDEFGAGILPELSLREPGSADRILRVSEILTEQAARKCKKYGIEDVPIFKTEEFKEADVMPYMYLDLQKACMDAANIGFEREITDEDEEVDLILLKRQKKRAISDQSTSKTE
jgi:hypothetical protein